MIRKIVMYRSNGMYTDKYDVLYNGKNGKTFWRTYTIKGEMMQKHFDFIMSHTAERIENVNGKHVADKWEEPDPQKQEEEAEQNEIPAPPLTPEELETVEALKEDGTLYSGNDVEPW